MQQVTDLPKRWVTDVLLEVASEGLTRFHVFSTMVYWNPQDLETALNPFLDKHRSRNLFLEFFKIVSSICSRSYLIRGHYKFGRRNDFHFKKDTMWLMNADACFDRENQTAYYSKNSQIRFKSLCSL